MQNGNLLATKFVFFLYRGILLAMATSLASQLKKLSAPQTTLLDERKNNVSILFDSSEAAKFGRDVYYEIGEF